MIAKVYAVEIDSGIDEQTLSYMDDVSILDIDESLFIVETKLEAEIIQIFCNELNITTQIMPLYQLNNPKPTTLFMDYGFQSKNGISYLYQETSIPFVIISGEPMQCDMALIQTEENLISTDHQELMIYFIDRQQIELIQGYANAYDIEVSFFDLDK